MYDKRDDFDFQILNFPYLDGGGGDWGGGGGGGGCAGRRGPRRVSYGDYISQLY